MKTLLKYVTSSLILLAMAFVFISCLEDENQPASIVLFTPTSGPIGTIVTITGSYFGKTTKPTT